MVTSAPLKTTRRPPAAAETVNKGCGARSQIDDDGHLFLRVGQRARKATWQKQRDPPAVVTGGRPGLGSAFVRGLRDRGGCRRTSRIRGYRYDRRLAGRQTEPGRCRRHGAGIQSGDIEVLADQISHRFKSALAGPAHGLEVRLCGLPMQPLGWTCLRRSTVGRRARQTGRSGTFTPHQYAFPSTTNSATAVWGSPPVTRPSPMRTA